jgi:hypothetical protein
MGKNTTTEGPTWFKVNINQGANRHDPNAKYAVQVAPGLALGPQVMATAAVLVGLPGVNGARYRMRATGEKTAAQRAGRGLSTGN